MGRRICLKCMTDTEVDRLRQLQSHGDAPASVLHSGRQLPTGSTRLRTKLLGIYMEDVLIGAVSLEQISWTAGRAELRIFIGPEEYRGRGYGTEAAKAMLQRAFYQWGLREIYLRVKPDNARAIACYRKCGFRLRGRLRAGRYAESGAEDLLLMTISRRQFELLTERGGMTPLRIKSARTEAR